MRVCPFSIQESGKVEMSYKKWSRKKRAKIDLESK